MADPPSRVFAALADPTRRDLVARLTDGDATVGQLAAPYRRLDAVLAELADEETGHRPTRAEETA